MPILCLGTTCRRRHELLGRQFRPGWKVLRTHDLVSGNTPHSMVSTEVRKLHLALGPSWRTGHSMSMFALSEQRKRGRQPDRAKTYSLSVCL